MINKGTVLSIIIPVYNAERTIVRTLESIVYQLDSEAEIVIVNDGSKDSSLHLCEEVLKRVNVKHQIYSIENSGVSEARNLGLSKAAGLFGLFLDADDTLSDNFYLYVKPILLTNAYDFIYYNFRNLSEDSLILKQTHNEKIESNIELLKSYLFQKLGLCIGSYIYRLSLAKNIRFRSDINYGEDQEFNIKYIFKCNRINYVREIYYNYFENTNSAMRKFNDKRFDVLKVFNDMVNDKKMQTFNELLNDRLIIEKLGIIQNLIEYGNGNLHQRINYFNENIKTYKIPKNLKKYKGIKVIQNTLSNKNLFLYCILLKCYLYIKKLKRRK